MSTELELENGLRVLINTEKFTAKVINASTKVTGTVFIPRYAILDKKKYSIIAIRGSAFSYVKFDSLIFAEDSEVESFEGSIFYFVSFKKLQIPPKLMKLSDQWCYCLRDLIDIEVSPKNKLFSFIDNKYLVCKSNPESHVFDILYYARYDIEEAVIPPQIEIIQENSFYGHPKLKSVVFPENSNLKQIKNCSFYQSTISKLVLPETLEYIHCNAFKETGNLIEIQISPKNKLFSMIDKTILVKKSDKSLKDFDVLVFCRRDAENVKIPSSIKAINANAFCDCNKLTTLTFEEESLLETIDQCAISFNDSLKSIVFPPSVKYIDEGCILHNYKLEFVEFLSDCVKIHGPNFRCCHKGLVLSFPNVKKLEFDRDTTKFFPLGYKIKIKQGAKLVGIGFLTKWRIIELIEGSETTIKNVDDISEKVENKKIQLQKQEECANKESSIKNKNSKNSEGIMRCMKRIRFLESRLEKYEEVVPFNLNSEVMDKELESDMDDKENDEEEERKSEQKNIFIDNEDESHQRVICQIGESETSVTYKVIDERRDQELCKKVLKAEEGKTTFNDVRNIYKEFEVLANMNHPSICKCIGINIQEKLIDNKKDSEDDDERGTTVAIFLKFHPMNLRECLERNILNNTLKAKLAVEIGFGMLYIHDNGMIHRNLKLENVMVNYIFEAQLIGFGLAHIDELNNTMTSMTKGIGTPAYMSPEMSNEEEYDNKTDVYSFGVLLFVLFTESFPQQNLKEILNNKQMKFPDASPAISPFTISLIKKCMSFEAKKRPSFEDIVSEMYKHSFKMAEGVDSEIVLHRFRTLNSFRSLNKRAKIVAKKPSSSHPNRPKSKFKPTTKPT